ncbi:hypothetical protein KJZ67_03765 [Patescibacteria group bacterium]|nr:hypothetical protein [Patescibacteria group bacterium]
MKNTKIIINIISNALLAAFFISLNIWAFNAQLEETFIFLAVSYGIMTIIVNALLIGRKS